MKKTIIFTLWGNGNYRKIKVIIDLLKKDKNIMLITLMNKESIERTEKTNKYKIKKSKHFCIIKREYTIIAFFSIYRLVAYLRKNLSNIDNIFFLYNHKLIDMRLIKLYMLIKLFRIPVIYIPRSIYCLERIKECSSENDFRKLVKKSLKRKLEIDAKIYALYLSLLPFLLFKKIFYSKKKEKSILKNPKKILFIRVDRFGDMVLTLPTLVELKQSFPNAELHLLCSPKGKGVVENQNTIYKFLGRIIVWKNIWDMHGGLIPGVKHFLNMLQLIFQLRKTKYDVVIQPIPLSIWTFLALLLKSRIIISTINCNLPLSRWLKKYIEYPIVIKKGEYIHYAQQSFNCLVPFGIKKGVERDFKLKYSVERVNLTVRKFIPNRINNNIVVNLSAGDRGRKLSKEKILQLINKLNINFMDYKIVLIGTQEDKILSGEMENNFSNIINLVGKTNINDLIYIFYNSKILITPDTGTMHLASFTDIFVIAYFGAGTLRHFAPITKNSCVIKHELGCSGCGDICFTKAYPKPCIDKITVDEILEAVKKALEIKGKNYD